jgi:hypothetical protein
MTIACLPIEIDVSLPDEQQILDYVEQYEIPSTLHLDGPRFDCWRVAPVGGQMPSDDWQDPYKIQQLICNRLTPNYGEFRWANNFDVLFPEVVSMISQIPIIDPLVILMQQLKDSTAHFDTQPQDNILNINDIALTTEPRRYNIQLTKFGKTSFFVAKTKTSEKIYYNHITPKFPAYCFPEQHYYHGADYIGPGKVSLCILGRPDPQRHAAMIKHNIEKHKDKAIIFEDGNDVFLY